MVYAQHDELIRALFENGITYGRIAERITQETEMIATEDGVAGYCRRQDWFEYRARHMRLLSDDTFDITPPGDNNWKRFY